MKNLTTPVTNEALIREMDADELDAYLSTTGIPGKSREIAIRQYMHITGNVPLNRALPMPVDPGIHEVLVACGYGLRVQTQYELVYRRKNERVCFSLLTGVSYATLLDGKWISQFECRFRCPTDPVVICDILNGIKAIDYFSLPEARKAITEALNAIRKRKVTPLTTDALQRAVS